MALKGRLIKKYIEALDNRNKKVVDFNEKCHQQRELLKSMLNKARKTQFGKFYGFESILRSNDFPEAYRVHVPLFNYESMYQRWWLKSVEGEKDVSWPGKIKYMALTSGTSLGATKRIPVTEEMISAISRTGFKHLCSIADYQLPASFFEKEILALGGSIVLKEFAAIKEGDMSGIITANLPKWLRNAYLPGNEIAKERDWNQKIAKIIAKAPEWDVGIIAGVPSWVLSMIQQIIGHYKLKTIHDIWPNFKVYAHGGVYIEPYISSFDRVINDKIYYSETYLASEGFFAYQSFDNGGMNLALSSGVYYEFLPFNNENFDSEGNVIQFKDVVDIENIEEGVEYALLLTTCSGAWRYLIGDTVRFVDKLTLEIQITGRTKHFVNLCGEHLSIDNLNEAINNVNSALFMGIQEYGLYPENTENGIYHHWVIAAEKTSGEEEVKRLIDNKLKENNADYRSVRYNNVKDLDVKLVSNQYLYEWMKRKGKNGGQNKFPRVLTKEQYYDILSIK